MDRLLERLEGPIKILMWLGLMAGFFMMVHITLDVIGRTVFNHPLAGTTEIVSAYYMVAVAYLPWAWVALNNGHITVELFTRRASPQTIAWLDIAAKILTIVYVSVFIWQTVYMAIQQTASGEAWEASTGYLPVWPSRWLLPVAGFAMTAHLVLRVIKDIGLALHHRASGADR
jgi:TRAP-type C4-dicarboxylate transport system permease small subunit